MVPTAGKETDSGYYRLRVETYPDAGKSRWSMAGCRMVFNTPGGLRHFTFGDDGTGTASDANGSGAFSWSWLRSGKDTGCVTVSWPDDSVECLEMEFLGTRSGVFRCERTTGGIPSGAVAGTFRDAEEDIVAATPSPAVHGSALLTFAGTGRAVAVALAGDGSAVIDGPTGVQTFAASYAVTGETEANLTLEGVGGITESWTLTFTGPACGTYLSRTERNGLLRRSGTGSFTVAPR
jgi:hypothetical protein